MQGYLVSLIIFTSIFAIFSLGLNLQWGFTGLINFGHVAFLAMGAYTTVLLSLQGVPLVLAALAGTLAAALLGLLMGLATLRLRTDYLAIVTVGVAEMIRLIAGNEQWLTRGTFGIQRFPLPEGGKIGLMFLSVWLLAMIYWGLERLVRSPWGRVLQAIREDEEVAKALGKNVFWYKLQALMLGGAIAGLAGALYAWHLTVVFPVQFDTLITFNAWVIVVIGGAGSNPGTVLGASIFWAYDTLTRFLLREIIPLSDASLGAFRMMVIGLILMAILVWRPQGILGKKEELTLGK